MAYQKIVTILLFCAVSSAITVCSRQTARADDLPRSAREAHSFAAELGEAKSVDADGFISLFNGKDLDGWDGDPKLWTVKDGVITGQTTKDNPIKSNTFLIYKGSDPADFELRLKVRYHGGNTGVQYRSKRRPDKENAWSVTGYQADLGSGKNHNGKLYEEKARGVLANVGETTVVHDDGKIQVLQSDPEAVKLSQAIKADEWFDYTITANGHHLTHQINGHTIIQCSDEQKGKAATSGVIAFQMHKGEPMTVEVKDVRIKEFKDAHARAQGDFEIRAAAPNGSFGTPGAPLIGGHEHDGLLQAIASRPLSPAQWRGPTSRPTIEIFLRNAVPLQLTTEPFELRRSPDTEKKQQP